MKTNEEYKASLICDLKQEIRYMDYNRSVAVLDIAGKQIVGMLDILLHNDIIARAEYKELRKMVEDKVNKAFSEYRFSVFI